MSSILDYCSKEIKKIKYDVPLVEIAKIFCDENVNYIFVVDDQDKILGIIKPKSVLRAIKDKKDIYRLKAEDIMKKNFFKLHKDSTLEECYDIFNKTKYQTIPIIDKENKKILGLINKKDISKSYNECKNLRIFNFKNRIKNIK